MKRQFLVILLGAGLALTACTGSPAGEVEGPPTASEQAPPGGQPTGPAPTPSTAATSSSNPSVSESSHLRDAKCTADDSGSWSFDAYLVNDQKQPRNFTVAIAVTVGMEVKGHDLVVQEVPGNSETHITRNYFAQTDDKNAVCEPVVSAEG